MTSTVQLAAGSYDNITTGNENKLQGESVMYLCLGVWESAHVNVCVCFMQYKLLVLSYNDL